MKISIILPVYNVEKYIGECLKSIMNQSYSDFECLIVDDCGEDNSIGVARSLIAEYTGKASFEIIESEKNGGISVARNKGIKRATGDFLMFVDSDDKLCPNALELLIDMTEKYPGVDLVQGNILCDKKSKYWNIAGRFPEFSSDCFWIREQILLWHIPVSVWGKLYRRELVASNNLTFMEGYMHEDVAWLFYFQKYISSIAFVEDMCYYYRTDNCCSVMHNADKDRTHSLLSYLELYKKAALEAYTMIEKKFVFNLLSPMKFVELLRDAKDTDVILTEINKTIDLFKTSSVDKVFLCQTKMFRLPLFVVNNPIFEKLYFLWGKKIGLS